MQTYGGWNSAENLFYERVYRTGLSRFPDSDRFRDVLISFYGRFEKKHPEAKKRRADLLLRDLAIRIVEATERHTPPPQLERARLRMSAARSVELCRHVVANLMEAAGSRAHFEDNPLQRMRRDLDTLASHVIFEIVKGAQAVGSPFYGNGTFGIGSEGQAGDAKITSFFLDTAGISQGEAAVKHQIHKSDVINRF